MTFLKFKKTNKFRFSVLCTIYLEPGWELNNYLVSSIVYQFYSRTCKCELISETQKALIAFNYCYSLITLNGYPAKICLKCLLLIHDVLKIWYLINLLIVGSMEAPSKAFLLFFLLPDWLKLNHLKSRMECGFSDIFSRHFCSTGAETIGLTNYAASFGAKKCSESHI